MNTLPITEADLHAFVDGKLPAARRLEVDAYLAQRPEEAERLRAYTAQNDELRALFNPVLDEAVPERLSAARPRQWQWQRLVAGLAIALFSGTTGWLLHGQQAGEIQYAQGDSMQARPAVRCRRPIRPQSPTLSIARMSSGRWKSGLTRKSS
jgi:anti-sigma factor RsiW